MTLLITLTVGLLLMALERAPWARYCPLPLRRAWVGNDVAYFAFALVSSALTAGSCSSSRRRWASSACRA